MKHKQNVLAVVISIFMITLLVGCGKANEPIKDDIIDYVNIQLPKVSGIESKVDKEYASVTGTNYKDDTTTCKMLTDNVIPDSLKLASIAKAITPKTDEVRGVHKLYLSAINEQNSSFTLLKSAIESQDMSEVSAATDNLATAKTDLSNYEAKVKDLETKYNVTIK